MISESQRVSGVLMSVSSLPNAEGIGSLGKQAKEFLDWLASAGFSVWQTLPLGPTGYGNSPYMVNSTFAGNPLFIDMGLLVDSGLLSAADLAPLNRLATNRVQYESVIPIKLRLLKRAYKAWKSSRSEDEFAAYKLFCDKNQSWLGDYALFAALKTIHNGKAWYQWPTPQKFRTSEVITRCKNMLVDLIEKEKWCQYQFFTQWNEIKLYANSLGISVLGDIPIFVSHDSCDVWVNRHLLKLNKDGSPKKVAGVPPDYFSATGQRWGNPVYDWDANESQDFHWWLSRIEHTLSYTDIVRIDHFRGFAACWEIPAEDSTAENGSWAPSKGRELLEALRADYGSVPLVAEDLGDITDDVHQLREDFSLPGMRVIQFAWDGDEQNLHLPTQVPEDMVYYTGTHDNNTILGWWESAGEDVRERVEQLLGRPVANPAIDLLEMVFAAPANYAIAPVQDLLGLGAEAIMNVPGTAENCWAWRMEEGALNSALAQQFQSLNLRTGRFTG